MDYEIIQTIEEKLIELYNKEELSEELKKRLNEWDKDDCGTLGLLRHLWLHFYDLERLNEKKTYNT